MKIDIKINKDKFYKNIEDYEKKVNIGLREIVKQNSVGLMYDLIGATFPFPSGHRNEGGTLKAFYSGMNGYFETIYKAFKPIQAIPFGVLAVNKDIDSMLVYGFRFNSEILQKELDNNNFDAIEAIFYNSGFQQDFKYKIVDNATIELLAEFRQKFPQNASSADKYDANYVRNVETIEKLRRAKNQVKIGLMAGGWLKCALKLGGKADKYTVDRRPLWMFGKGSGYATIKDNGKTVVCVNNYGNFGGWAESEGIQSQITKRRKIVQTTLKEFFINLK